MKKRQKNIQRNIHENNYNIIILIETDTINLF
jgi:hypothetical protein